MTEGLAPTVQARFAALQRHFVAGLPARWLELEAATTAATRQAVLHRLCGAAGSFGLERLSASARAAEELALAGSPEALAQALARLQLQIKLAQSSVRAGVAPTPP